eukprot:555068-Rhodomonas_salina.3
MQRRMPSYQRHIGPTCIFITRQILTCLYGGTRHGDGGGRSDTGICLRFATRCPVLTQRLSVCLRARYAMSGTDVAQDGLRMRVLRDARYRCSIWYHETLRACYAMSGTHLALGSQRELEDTMRMIENPQEMTMEVPPAKLLRRVSCCATATVCGTDGAYDATRRQRSYNAVVTSYGILLRACYVQPDTDLALVFTTRINTVRESEHVNEWGMTTGLQVLAYAYAVRCPVPTELMVLSAYARGTRCSVLTLRMVLWAYARATRSPVLDRTYGAIGLRACYAMSGTDIVYAHRFPAAHARGE